MKKVITILLALTVMGLPAFAAGQRSKGNAADTAAVSRQVYQARVDHLNGRMEQAWNNFQESVCHKKHNKKNFQRRLNVLMEVYLCLGLYGNLEDVELWTETLRTPIQTGKNKTFDLVAFLEKNPQENTVEMALFLQLLKLDDFSQSKPLFLEWYHALFGLASPGFIEDEQGL